MVVKDHRNFIMIIVTIIMTIIVIAARPSSLHDRHRCTTVIIVIAARPSSLHDRRRDGWLQAATAIADIGAQSGK